MHFRLFSLREANGLVATLQQQFIRARALRGDLSELQRKLSEAGHPIEGPELAVDVGAPASVRKLQERARKLLGELEALLRELTELGVEVKGAEGLVDLRSKLHGRVVYLCWQFGEERIGHWHELDAGFPGRKPLPIDGDFVGDLLH